MPNIVGLFYGNPSLVDNPPRGYYWYCFGGSVPRDRRKRVVRQYRLKPRRSRYD